jgi:hypothetical protein
MTEELANVLASCGVIYLAVFILFLARKNSKLADAYDGVCAELAAARKERDATRRAMDNFQAWDRVTEELRKQTDAFYTKLQEACAEHALAFPTCRCRVCEVLREEDEDDTRT